METGRFAIYLCGESEAGTITSAKAWCKRHEVDPFDKNTRFMFIPRAPDLLKREDTENLVSYLKDVLPEDSKPVVFIDTWQRATASGSQNDDDQMQNAIRNAEFIGKELRAPVVIACHPPKSNKGTVLGSSVIENSSVAIWQMDRFGPLGAQRKVQVTRIKGAGEGKQLFCRIDTVGIGGTDPYDCPLKGAVLIGNEQLPGAITTGRFADQDIPDQHEQDLLVDMLNKPNLSFVKRAESLEWKGETDKLNASRVKNKMKNLKGRGLVTKTKNGNYVLTEQGQEAAERIRTKRAAPTEAAAEGSHVTSMKR